MIDSMNFSLALISDFWSLVFAFLFESWSIIDRDTIVSFSAKLIPLIPFDDLPLKSLIFSTLNLIDYGIRISSKRIIYASSMAVYGEVPDYPITENNLLKPLSCYGNSKLSSEKYLQIYFFAQNCTFSNCLLESLKTSLIYYKLIELNLITFCILDAYYLFLLNIHANSKLFV